MPSVKLQSLTSISSTATGVGMYICLDGSNIDFTGRIFTLGLDIVQNTQNVIIYGS